MDLTRRSAGVVLGLVMLLVGPAAWAEFDEHRSIESERLVLRNLIGRIDVSGHAGSAFEVDIAVRGADGTRERVEIEFTPGHEAQLNVAFPVTETRDYVYPELGQGQVRFDSGGDDASSWIRRLFGGGQIEVKGKGDGLEVWADVTVRVPRGGNLRVEHGVGETVARNVDGELDLGSRAGRVTVDDVQGSLVVDTGSGAVRVEDVHGARILIDTGSGSVDVEKLEGDEVTIDTGSGSVGVRGVVADEITIDTGSGGVEVSGAEADDLTVDTGSGSVDVEITRMGGGHFEIDTGSGSIDLRLPSDASAEIRAETGSGSVRFELGSDAKVVHQERDAVELRVGAAEAKVRLDTGSGSIHISR